MHRTRLIHDGRMTRVGVRHLDKPHLFEVTGPSGVPAGVAVPTAPGETAAYRDPRPSPRRVAIPLGPRHSKRTLATVPPTAAIASTTPIVTFHFVFTMLASPTTQSELALICKDEFLGGKVPRLPGYYN